MCFKYSRTSRSLRRSRQPVRRTLCRVAEDELPAGSGGGAADLSVRVAVAEHLGHTSCYFYAAVAGAPLIIGRPASRPVGLSARRCFPFDAAGKRLR